MSKTKNRYLKKAKHEQIMQILKDKASAKGDIPGSAALGIRDLIIGVIGGGAAAAVLGKWSLPAGLLIAIGGNYKDSKAIQVLGIATMTSNGFTKLGGGVNGLEGLDGVKERLQAYKASLSDKFFLDKIMKKKGATTNGLGEMQYFTYPDNSVGELAALNDIERQLADSAMEYQQMTGNNYEEVGEIEERLY